MSNSDLLDDLNRTLSEKLRLTVEEHLRNNMKTKRKVEISSYDTFISDNISLDVDEEIITDCKGKCILLSTSMFIDNWLYIDEQGVSYIYLNILCQYANNNQLNTLIIPDFVDVIILNSKSEIEYNGKIVFNENLKAITSYYEPADKNYIVVSDNNIYLRTISNITKINSLDFSKCKNISKLVSGSFCNIEIQNLIFSDYLLLIQREAFNKEVNNITLSENIIIEPSVMEYINKCKSVRAIKINRNNVEIIISPKMNYITNKVILDIPDMFMYLHRNNYPISYKNFNTLYIKISPTKFMDECDVFIKKLMNYANDNNILNMEVYNRLIDNKELENELLNVFNTIFINDYKGKLFTNFDSKIIIKCLEHSNISFFDYLYYCSYYCSDFINLNTLYKQCLLYIYKIVSDSYKRVNIIFYNGDISNEVDDIVEREYILSKICSKNNKVRTQYNFSVDKTLTKLLGE